MFDIRLLQRCEPGCKLNNRLVAELQGVLGFGTLGEGGKLFATDGGQRVCLNEICPACGDVITYVTDIKMEGEENV